METRIRVTLTDCEKSVSANLITKFFAFASVQTKRLSSVSEQVNLSILGFTITNYSNSHLLPDHQASAFLDVKLITINEVERFNQLVYGINSKSFATIEREYSYIY